MVYDSTDEKFRKPRRLRNTPLQKYVRIISASITLLFALGTYITFRRHVLPHVKGEKKDILTEEQIEMSKDYASNIFMRGIIDELNKRREENQKAEAESNDTQ